VLIVPGHEPDNGGTNYKNIYERNLVVPIADDLQNFLNADSHYQTFITRDIAAWDPTFAAYFQNDWNQIISWEKSAKISWKPMNALNQSSGGEISNAAATDDALRLYGITKWADENNIDLMIHMHLNNYPDAMAKQIVGKYSGLVMYMPADDLANSVVSKPIAEAVFNRLSLYNPISNLPVESQGLETDDSLIAMGAYNTAKMATMLIEYDYIYEPQFVSPAVRPIALKDFAYQTYLGLQDYYDSNTNVTAKTDYDPSANVYDWTTPITSTNSNADDIYAEQTALIMDGDYPPAGMTRNDCPHSGTFGACTRLAIEAFQKKNNINESVFGSKTFYALQRIYDQK
jgi:N-acetylmuramoyl-L-alanine amidase